ncbi:MAG: c-type cytochrome [Gammaproteobacteria bacterium]|nr:c-type cytochrome [Gammaproteobacteria bacterium]
MTAALPSKVALLVLLGYFGCAVGGNSNTKKEEIDEEKVATEDALLIGNIEAGEQRYKKTCINCHGAAGKGVASYPKVSGQDIPYTISKLETYRNGTKVGPNSSLMIMMAKPLTDQEIADLAAYLEVATP